MMKFTAVAFCLLFLIAGFCSILGQPNYPREPLRTQVVLFIGETGTYKTTIANCLCKGSCSSDKDMSLPFAVCSSNAGRCSESVALGISEEGYFVLDTPGLEEPNEDETPHEDGWVPSGRKIPIWVHKQIEKLVLSLGLTIVHIIIPMKNIPPLTESKLTLPFQLWEMIQNNERLTGNCAIPTTVFINRPEKSTQDEIRTFSNAIKTKFGAQVGKPPCSFANIGVPLLKLINRDDAMKENPRACPLLHVFDGQLSYEPKVSNFFGHLVDKTDSQEYQSCLYRAKNKLGELEIGTALRAIQSLSLQGVAPCYNASQQLQCPPDHQGVRSTLASWQDDCEHLRQVRNIARDSTFRVPHPDVFFKKVREHFAELKLCDISAGIELYSPIDWTGTCAYCPFSPSAILRLLNAISFGQIGAMTAGIAEMLGVDSHPCFNCFVLILFLGLLGFTGFKVLRNRL